MVEQRDAVMSLGPLDPAHDLIQAVPALPALLSLVRDPDENARRPNSEALWPDLRLSRSRSQQPVRLRSSHQSSRLTSRKVSVVRAGSNHERSLDRPRAAAIGDTPRAAFRQMAQPAEGTITRLHAANRHRPHRAHETAAPACGQESSSES